LTNPVVGYIIILSICSLSTFKKRVEMPRPMKWRRIAHMPQFTYFKPVGIPLRELNEVVISVDEMEAIRLKDIEGLEQEQGAVKMNISRPTFQRMLISARGKVADALINGKAIRIEGGSFDLARRRFRCGVDGYEWEVPFEEISPERPPVCPECNTPQELPVMPPGFQGRGGGHGRGRGGGRGRHRGARGW
jgi:predicted DNA-binding protein (UPF0251 family)